MLPVVALSVLLLAGSAQEQQSVRRAVELVKDIEPGASSADVAARTAPLGAPRVVFLHCSTGGEHRCAQAPEDRATKRVATWAISDRRLVVTFCGRAGAWKMAALSLSSADRIDPTAMDPEALIWKYDSNVAAACESPAS